MRMVIARLFLIALTLTAAAGVTLPQHSPYAGQQHRDIKALSPEDVDALLNGHGMGLAKAAELNRYPGPKHVLELAGELRLSEEQKRGAQASFDRMHARATALGKQIVEKERQLDVMFASEKADADSLRKLVAEIGRLQGELRLAHLEAHLEMKRLLSPEQVARYVELRGYGKGEGHHQHDHRKHGGQ